MEKEASKKNKEVSGMENFKQGKNREYVAYVTAEGKVDNDAEGKVTKVQVDYSLGGYNFFSGNYNKRGYRVSFRKVEVSRKVGYKSESYILLGDKNESGYVLVEEANRYNAKKLAEIATKFDSAVTKVAEYFLAEQATELVAFVKQVGA